MDRVMTIGKSAILASIFLREELVSCTLCALSRHFSLIAFSGNLVLSNAFH